MQTHSVVEVDDVVCNVSHVFSVTLSLAQSSSTTPRMLNFFANASLRFSAFAAVAIAASIALGPFFSTVFISPSLCAASACALLKVAINSAWRMDEFIDAALYKTRLLALCGRIADYRGVISARSGGLPLGAM